MLLLILDELQIFGPLFGVNLSPLKVALFDCVEFALKLNDLEFFFSLLLLVLINAAVQVSFAIFGLNLLAHGKGHTALIKGLVSGNGHLNLVTDAEEKKTALSLTERYLSDDLIEALGEELFTNWADA